MSRSETLKKSRDDPVERAFGVERHRRVHGREAVPSRAIPLDERHARGLRCRRRARRRTRSRLALSARSERGRVEPLSERVVEVTGRRAHSPERRRTSPARRACEHERLPVRASRSASSPWRNATTSSGTSLPERPGPDERSALRERGDRNGPASVARADGRRPACRSARPARLGPPANTATMRRRASGSPGSRPSPGGPALGRGTSMPAVMPSSSCRMSIATDDGARVRTTRVRAHEGFHTGMAPSRAKAVVGTRLRRARRRRIARALRAGGQTSSGRRTFRASSTCAFGATARGSGVRPDVRERVRRSLERVPRACPHRSERATRRVAERSLRSVGERVRDALSRRGALTTWAIPGPP